MENLFALVWLLEVLNKRRLGHVNRQLANVRNIIADPFQMLSHKKQPRIARRGGGFGHHHFNQLVKNVVIEFVDLSVALNNFARYRRIVRGEGVQRRS